MFGGFFSSAANKISSGLQQASNVANQIGLGDANPIKKLQDEFLGKINELEEMSKAAEQIRETIDKFPERTKGIQETCQSVYNVFLICYKGEKMFSKNVSDLADSHRGIEEAHQECCKTMAEISKKTDEWNRTFNDINKLLQQKEITISIDNAQELINLTKRVIKASDDLIHFRERFINPMVCGMISAEKKFFDLCSKFLEKFGPLVAGYEKDKKK